MTSNNSGMSMYMMDCVDIAMSRNSEDPITFEQLNILKDSSHPRGSISICRDNNKPYFYNVETIIKIIENGDGKDPFTRKPFDSITKERAYLYYSITQKLPNLKKEELDFKTIYTDWLNDKNDELKLLKAQCLLQPSDLLDLFREYEGKGSKYNRKHSIIELKNKPKNSWILRNTSVIDTDIYKGYCLSVKSDNIKHHLIVHKIGYGIYFGVELNRNQIIPENFSYDKIYPSIIHLIMDKCY